MKSIVPRIALVEALGAVTALVGSRTPKPILGCVRIAAEDDVLRLSATDGEAGLHLSVPTLQIARAGVAVVPADRLQSIVREMPDVELQIEADDRYCTVRGSGGEFRIFVMNPADFPPVPGFEGDADVVVGGHNLRRMIGLTLYAAARETSRFAINGVLWEKVGKRLYLVATDGRRLARASDQVERTNAADFRAILPAKALSVFEKVFTPPRDGDDWAVQVRVLPNQVLLRDQDRVLSSVLIEGSFPDYHAVIPTSHDKRARINREELFRAVRRAALLTTEESRAVRLAFSAKELVITSQAPEQGDARVEVSAEFSGTPVEIGFNPAFLTDVLGRLPQEEVFLELQESHRPGVLCGEDKDEFLYVLMPVSLSN